MKIIQHLIWFTSTITFAFFCATVIPACTAKSPSETDTLPEIRIGVIVYNPVEGMDPLTMTRAAQMAVGEVNSVAGLTLQGKKHQVTWIRESVNAGVPEESVAAVQRLINQHNVVAVIGPSFSVDAIPAGEIAELSGIPLITPLSTNPRATSGRKFVFRVGFLDEFQGRVAALFVRSELQIKNAAVLYNIADPYSRGLAEVFKKQLLEVNGRIVAFESYAGAEDDISRKLLKIREKQPEVLYLPTFSEQATKVILMAKELKVNSLFFGSDAWGSFPIERLQEFDGAYMTTHYSDAMPGEKNRKFVTSYREKFNLLPDSSAAMSYDAFQLVFAALKYKGSADPRSIRDGLYEMGPYEGVTGYIDFVENGDPVKGVVILQIKDRAMMFTDFMEGE